ncbi:MAG: phage major capsid protein [Prevotella sp.]|jgi:HK97 family phage major capsid protein|nr:phage major capsid protein [Prevotella sp.]
MTEKEKKELRENRSRILEIRTAVTTLNDTIKKENRALTEDERKQVKDYEAEIDHLKLRSLELENPKVISAPQISERSQDVVCRDTIRSLVSKRGIPDEYSYLRSRDGDPNQMVIPFSRESMQETIKQYRDTTVQTTADVTPVVPMTIHDIIEPLEKGLILGQLGLHVQSGIVGAWNYPVVEAVTAEWEGENDQATSKKIALSSITPKPHRLPLQIYVSNQAIWQSAGSIRNIVLTQIAAGLQRKLNETMFALTNSDEKGIVPDGCFANVLAKAKISLTSPIAYKDINNLRAAVEATGVQLTSPGFVCSTSMYYTLKSTPRDAGSGIMIIDAQNTIDGVPVFRTEYVPANFLGYGLFGYELLGQFGNVTLGIDSSSAAVAGTDMTAFTINSRWDMMAFRNEAFGYIQVTSGTTGTGTGA